MNAARCQGMTLIEVLLSLLILFVTTLIVAQALSTVLKLEHQSSIMSEASPHLSTLIHDHMTGIDGSEPTLDEDGWILEPRNQDDEVTPRLYDMVPVSRRTFRISLVL